MAGITIQQVREKFPMYGDLSDQALAEALHRKFYADMDRAEFDRRIGYAPVPPVAADVTAPPQPSDMAGPRYTPAPAADAARMPVQPFAPPSKPMQGTPFDGENTSQLLTRRGQEVVAGTVDVFASVPEAAALIGTGIETNVRDAARRRSPEMEAEAAQIEATLASGQPMTEGQRRVLTERLALLREAAPAQAEAAPRDVRPASERALFKAGDDLRAFSARIVGPAPRDDSFWSMVSTGGGNLIGLATVGYLTGPVPAASVAASQMAAGTYKEAKAAGASEEDALRAAGLASFVGATDIIPLARALRPLESAAPEVVVAVAARIRKALVSGGEEAAQEAVQGILSNLIAEGLYDPERGVLDGVTEQALAGAVLGALAGTVGGLTPGERAPTATDRAAAVATQIDAAAIPPAQPPVPMQDEANVARVPAPATPPAQTPGIRFGLTPESRPNEQTGTIAQMVLAELKKRGIEPGKDAPPAAKVTEPPPGISPNPDTEQAPRAIEATVAKIIGNESSGDPNAKNPKSTATGLGQFISGTWLAMIRKHRPDLAQGRTEAEILALRRDPAISREMTTRYTEDNGAFLEGQGLPVTEATLYLAHFAGPGGAANILRADPGATVESVLGADVVRANPFLRDMTAGDLIEWAARKMGGDAPVSIAPSAAPEAPQAAPAAPEAPTQPEAPKPASEFFNLPEAAPKSMPEPVATEAGPVKVERITKPRAPFEEPQTNEVQLDLLGGQPVRIADVIRKDRIAEVRAEIEAAREQGITEPDPWTETWDTPEGEWVVRWKPEEVEIEPPDARQGGETITLRPDATDAQIAKELRGASEEMRTRLQQEIEDEYRQIRDMLWPKEGGGLDETPLREAIRNVRGEDVDFTDLDPQERSAVRDQVESVMRVKDAIGRWKVTNRFRLEQLAEGRDRLADGLAKAAFQRYPPGATRNAESSASAGRDLYMTGVMDALEDKAPSPPKNNRTGASAYNAGFKAARAAMDADQPKKKAPVKPKKPEAPAEASTKPGASDEPGWIEEGRKKIAAYRARIDALPPERRAIFEAALNMPLEALPRGVVQSVAGRKMFSDGALDALEGNAEPTFLTPSPSFRMMHQKGFDWAREELEIQEKRLRIAQNGGLMRRPGQKEPGPPRAVAPFGNMPSVVGPQERNPNVSGISIEEAISRDATWNAQASTRHRLRPPDSPPPELGWSQRDWDTLSIGMKNQIMRSLPAMIAEQEAKAAREAAAKSEAPAAPAEAPVAPKPPRKPKKRPESPGFPPNAQERMGKLPPDLRRVAGQVRDLQINDLPVEIDRGSDQHFGFFLGVLDAFEGKASPERWSVPERISRAQNVGFKWARERMAPGVLAARAAPSTSVALAPGKGRSYVPLLRRQPGIERPDNGKITLDGKTLTLPDEDTPIFRANIRRAVVEIMGERLYQGKVRGKGVQGLYTPKSGAVRIRHFDDLEVLAHEFAHWLDLHSSTAKDWQDFRKTQPGIQAFSYTDQPNLAKLEGFAELVRLWFTQYDAAKAAEPDLVAAFDALVAQMPEGRAMRRIREQMHLYYAQGALAKGMANMGESLTTGERIKRSLAQYGPEILRQRMIDRFHGAKVVERTTNRDLMEGARSASKLYQLAAGGWEGVHEAVMQDGTVQISPGGDITFSGESLMDVLKPVRKNMRTFNRWLGYAAARRAQELKAQGRERLFDDDQIAALLAQGEGRPEFAEVFDAYQGFNRRMLEFYRAADLITPDQFAAFQKANKQYVPFHRVIDGLEAGLDGGSGAQINRSLRGGEQNIRDVALNMVEGTASNIRAALLARAKARMFKDIMASDDGALFAVRIPEDSAPVQVAKQQLADKFAQAMQMNGVGISEKGLIRANPDSPIIVDRQTLLSQIDQHPELMTFWAIVPPTTSGETMVDSAIIDGERVWFEVRDPLLAEMLTRFAALPDTNPVLAVAQWWKRMMTRTVTYGIQFVVKNLFLDTTQATIMSRRNFVPVLTSLRGMANFALNTQAMREFRANGGLYATSLQNATREGRARARLQVAPPEFRHGPMAAALYRANRALAAWDRFTTAFEVGTRVGQYVIARNAGASMTQAAWEGREIGTDFSKSGSDLWLRGWGSTIPFFNATVQGLDLTARKLMEHKGRMTPANALRLDRERALFIAKGLAFLAAPTIALWAFNRDEEWFQELTDDDRARFLWIKAPGMDEPIRIPKPYDLGHIFMTAPEAALEWLYQKDGTRASGLMAFALHQTFVDPVNDLPGIISPFVEAAANRDWKGTPIVPPGLDKVTAADPSLQYNERTGLVFVQLGEALGISPMQAQHYWSATTGYLGRYVTDAAEAALWREDLWGERPEARSPLVSYPLAAFLGQKVPFRTKYTESFWALRDRAEGARQALSQARRMEIKYPDAKQRIREDAVLSALVSADKGLDRIMRGLGVISDQVTAAKYDPALSAAEKTARIEGLYAERNARLKEVFLQTEAAIRAAEKELSQ